MQPLRAMSGSGVLIWPRAMLMAVAHVTTEAQVNARGLDCHLKPC